MMVNCSNFLLIFRRFTERPNVLKVRRGGDFCALMLYVASRHTWGEPRSFLETAGEAEAHGCSEMPLGSHLPIAAWILV